MIKKLFNNFGAFRVVFFLPLFGFLFRFIRRIVTRFFYLFMKCCSDFSVKLLKAHLLLFKNVEAKDDVQPSIDREMRMLVHGDKVANYTE